MRKYELLMMSKTISYQRSIANVVEFLNEVLDNIDEKQFFLTYEMTLFIYNIMLNTNSDYTYLTNKYWKFDIENQVIEIIRQLFGKKIDITENHVEKIRNDINFIVKYKKYTYVYDIVYYIFFFFFSDI